VSGNFAIDAGAVADAFGLGDHPIVVGGPVRGELGEVWRLRTDAGSWAVKRCFDAQAEDALEQSAHFQRAAIANGVFAPRIVPSRDGVLLAALGGARVRVYEWVDLAPLDRGLDVDALGAAVAGIHTAGYRGVIAGPGEWFLEPVSPRQWDAVLDALWCAGAPFAPALAGHRTELADAAALVRRPRILQACHRDLWADNVRAAAAGEICVFDWDNAGLADPGHELSMVLWEFCRADAERAAGLYAAYLRADGPGRVEGPESFSMVISVASRLLHRLCRLWLDPATGQPERDRRVREIEEWIRDPCNRADIEFLLAATHR
jgi:Ser/Thr protein kinase RdoA (MazF antagonist)